MSLIDAVSSQANVVEVFSDDFSKIYQVPKWCIKHMPPRRLNINRLVLCKNYLSGRPRSCKIKGSCRFVHADVDRDTLPSYSIHVKYAWRSQDECTYERLPPGDLVSVSAPNDMPPLEYIPSEQILVTEGALSRHRSTFVSHCAHYLYNRLCTRGTGCYFIHVAYVDSTVTGSFSRAPRYRTGVVPIVVPQSPERPFKQCHDDASESDDEIIDSFAIVCPTAPVNGKDYADVPCIMMAAECLALFDMRLMFE